MIIRTYRCLDCGVMFEVDHDSGDEPEPPCPQCDVVLQWMPKSFNIGTTKGKAVDYTQKILEEDYGLTNFKDNQREGDTVAIIEPESREMRDAKAKIQDDTRAALNDAPAAITNKPEVQAAIKTFWSGGGQGMISANLPGAMAGVRTGPGAYTAENNPMASLHRAGAKGLLPNNMRIVAKA